MNVASEVINDKTSTSTYLVESIDVWYARLGHVNCASIKRLRKLDLIPRIEDKEINQCEICVEAKFAKKSFKYVENRKTELLELIHTELTDFRSTMSRGGKSYYISFVDDFSRYTRIYLLKTKDEAADTF